MIHEYELIEFSIEIPYEADNTPAFASEDGPQSFSDANDIECDTSGIPMGNSLNDIKSRERIIADFFRQWSANNVERQIRNEALNDYIYVRGISIIEAREHSAKNYKSTLAVLILDEVLRNAKPVRRVPTKKGNKNQAPFAYMLIMVYRHPEIGTIKLTVGVKSSEQHIEYGLTALNPGQSLIENITKKKKKRSSR